MVHIDGLGPSMPDPGQNPSDRHISTEVKCLSERIYITIGYSLRDPKEYEKTFLNLAILMHFEEKEILSEIEHRDLAEELKNIRDSLGDGSFRIHESIDALQRLVDETSYKNPKAKILASLIELEHILCIQPQKDDLPSYLEDFQSVIAPVLDLINQNLTSIQSTLIYQDMEGLKEEIASGDIGMNDALERVKITIEETIRKI